MPFDLSNKTCHQHSIISDLVQQADEALAACERDTCVDLIQHIYELLDLATAARVAIPAATHSQTVPGFVSAIVEHSEQRH